jgi:hypothetical protein
MSNDLQTAMDRDLQAARVPMYARQERIEADYVDALHSSSTDLRDITALSERRRGALRALAEEFAPVFAMIRDFYGAQS